MLKTVVVQIGNSDDKLTQTRWSGFCQTIHALLRGYAHRIHFTGYSVPDAVWQNACFVAEIEEDILDEFFRDIKAQRIIFDQNSVAITVGDTGFI